VVLGRNVTDLNGSGSLITDSANIVKHILDSNPGKVVYIDISATWCGPCMKQIPYSKALHEELVDKPIVFVYLWLDGKTERGKNIIASLDLPGIHIDLADKEWQDVMKRFNVEGVPHFLIFDKKGVMVDYGRHLRPALPETKVAIEKLLEE